MKTVTFKAQEEMTYKVALTICLSEEDKGESL